MRKVILFCLALLALAGGVAWLILETRPDSSSEVLGASDPEGRGASPATGAAGQEARNPPGRKAASARPRSLNPRSRSRRARHQQRLRAIMDKLRAAQEASGGQGPTGSGGATPEEESPSGTLSGDYIRSAMKEIQPLIKECYQNALAAKPDLSGRMVVSFEIAGDSELGGLVTESKLDPERSTITSPGLKECVRETMYALELPAPEGGGTVEVNMPFIFHRKDSKKQEAPEGRTEPGSAGAK